MVKTLLGPFWDGDGSVRRLHDWWSARVSPAEPFELAYVASRAGLDAEAGAFRVRYLGMRSGVAVVYAVGDVPCLFGSDLSTYARLSALGAEAAGCRCHYWSDLGAPAEACLELARAAGVPVREGGDECLANGIYISSVGEVGEPSRLDEWLG